MTMRQMLLPGLLAAVLSTPLAAEADAPLKIGAAMPMANAKLLSVDGKQLTLAGVSGAKGTLVIFSCNSCPWAKSWEPRIVEIGNAYAKRGVGVIVVNSNDPGVAPGDGYEAMQARAKEREMAFPYAVDGTSDLARAFGATRTPEVFLFNAKGKLIYHGAVDDNAREPENVKARYLRDALETTLAGGEVKVKETKALGCGIKFRAKSTS